MYKIVNSDMESPDPGGYNREPKGMVEISEAEFAQSAYFVWMAEAIETRQIITSVNDAVYSARRGMYPLMIFWMDTDPKQASGFAIRHDYYEGKIRYFRVGCDHDYGELSQKEARKRGIAHFGNCYHVTECKKCGKILSYDSSG
jgi:hypothetical protein